MPTSNYDPTPYSPSGTPTLETIHVTARAVHSSAMVKIAEGAFNNGPSVTFAVTPEISEQGSTSYVEVSEIRQAASILVYLGSPSRTFSINAKLVSRSQEEAKKNFGYLHLMKSWRMPVKGSVYHGARGGHLDADAPPVLYIYGYGENFKGIQVVMKSINIDWTPDVDYISTGDGDTKMPIILSVSMSFQEIRSGLELELFTLEDYKAGQLETW